MFDSIRTKLCALFIVILASSAMVRAADDAPATAPSSDAFALVSSMVGGEWRIEAKWSSGAPLKARATYDWGVGKKFVSAKTFVDDGKGGEYQRYETIFGIEDGRLMAWGFVFDGHVDKAQYKLDGKKLSSSKPMPGKDGAPSKAILHQSIELTDPNLFHWVVVIENDGKMDQVMDGTWVRQSVGRAK